MPAYFKILIYLAVACAAGAAVAPPVFWAGQSLAATDVSDWLAGFPFHRVLSRCLQISLLVFLWPALRWIGLLNPAQLGLRSDPVGPRDAAAGLLLGAASVALVSAACFSAGLMAWRADPAIGAFGRILLTAGVVSVVEETVFRGIVLGVCLWNLPVRASVSVSAALFALVHFLKPGKSKLGAEAVQWTSGFSELFSFADALPPGAVLICGAASLFVAGWILGQATVRTRSLWLPIGLHAGWIVGMQTSNIFLRLSGDDPAASLPWVGPSLVSGAVPTGLLPLGGLIVAAWLVRMYLRYVNRPSLAETF